MSIAEKKSVSMEELGRQLDLADAAAETLLVIDVVESLEIVKCREIAGHTGLDSE